MSVIGFDVKSQNELLTQANRPHKPKFLVQFQKSRAMCHFREERLTGVYSVPLMTEKAYRAKHINLRQISELVDASTFWISDQRRQLRTNDGAL